MEELRVVAERRRDPVQRPRAALVGHRAVRRRSGAGPPFWCFQRAAAGRLGVRLRQLPRPRQGRRGDAAGGPVLSVLVFALVVAAASWLGLDAAATRCGREGLYPLALALVPLALLVACGGAARTAPVSAATRSCPSQQRGLLPSMKIAEPAPWGDQRPTVPEGTGSPPSPPTADPAADPGPSEWRHPGRRRAGRRRAGADAEGRHRRLHQGAGARAR